MLKSDMNQPPDKRKVQIRPVLSCTVQSVHLFLCLWVAVLILRNTTLYFPCCGSGMFIPDPGSFHSGSSRSPGPGSRVKKGARSRIRNKQFKYFFKSKNGLKALGNMIRDVYSGSWIQNPEFFRFKGIKNAPYPGSETL
jgi:hypothetical protein